MKTISNEMHAVLDYVTVIIFALAPTVLGLSGAAAVISYVLAFVHLAMTFVTDMPFTLLKVVPIKLHALVELVVGPVLIIGGLLLPFSTTGRVFFVALGVIIFVVWLLSSYIPVGRSGPKPA